MVTAETNYSNLNSINSNDFNTKKNKKSLNSQANPFLETSTVSPQNTIARVNTSMGIIYAVFDEKTSPPYNAVQFFISPNYSNNFHIIKDLSRGNDIPEWTKGWFGSFNIFIVNQGHSQSEQDIIEAENSIGHKWVSFNYGINWKETEYDSYDNTRNVFCRAKTSIPDGGIVLIQTSKDLVSWNTISNFSWDIIKNICADPYSCGVPWGAGGLYAANNGLYYLYIGSLDVNESTPYMTKFFVFDPNNPNRWTEIPIPSDFDLYNMSWRVSDLSKMYYSGSTIYLSDNSGSLYYIKNKTFVKVAFNGMADYKFTPVLLSLKDNVGLIQARSLDSNPNYILSLEPGSQVILKKIEGLISGEDNKSMFYNNITYLNVLTSKNDSLLYETVNGKDFCFQNLDYLNNINAVKKLNISGDVDIFYSNYYKKEVLSYVGSTPDALYAEITFINPKPLIWKNINSEKKTGIGQYLELSNKETVSLSVSDNFSSILDSLDIGDEIMPPDSKNVIISQDKKVHKVIPKFNDKYIYLLSVCSGTSINVNTLTYYVWGETKMTYKPKFSSYMSSHVYSNLVINSSNYSNDNLVIALNNSGTSAISFDVEPKKSPSGVKLTLDISTSYYVKLDGKTLLPVGVQTSVDIGTNIINTDGIYKLHLQDVVGNSTDTILELGAENEKLPFIFGDTNWTTQDNKDRLKKINTSIELTKMSDNLEQNLINWVSGYNSYFSSQILVQNSLKSVNKEFSFSNDDIKNATTLAPTVINDQNSSNLPDFKNAVFTKMIDNKVDSTITNFVQAKITNDMNSLKPFSTELNTSYNNYKNATKSNISGYTTFLNTYQTAVQKKVASYLNTDVYSKILKELNIPKNFVPSPDFYLKSNTAYKYLKPFNWTPSLSYNITDVQKLVDVNFNEQSFLNDLSLQLVSAFSNANQGLLPQEVINQLVGALEPTAKNLNINFNYSDFKNINSVQVFSNYLTKFNDYSIMFFDQSLSSLEQNMSFSLGFNFNADDNSLNNITNYLLPTDFSLDSNPDKDINKAFNKDKLSKEFKNLVQTQFSSQHNGLTPEAYLQSQITKAEHAINTHGNSLESVLKYAKADKQSEKPSNKATLDNFKNNQSYQSYLQSESDKYVNYLKTAARDHLIKLIIIVASVVIFIILAFVSVILYAKSRKHKPLSMKRRPFRYHSLTKSKK